MAEGDWEKRLSESPAWVPLANATGAVAQAGEGPSMRRRRRRGGMNVACLGSFGSDSVRATWGSSGAAFVCAARMRFLDKVLIRFEVIRRTGEIKGGKFV